MFYNLFVQDSFWYRLVRRAFFIELWIISKIKHLC